MSKFNEFIEAQNMAIEWACNDILKYHHKGPFLDRDEERLLIAGYRAYVKKHGLDEELCMIDGHELIPTCPLYDRLSDLNWETVYKEGRFKNAVRTNTLSLGLWTAIQKAAKQYEV